MKRLTDEQLEALFLAHFTRTRDLLGSLKLVVDAEQRGTGPAFTRIGADERHLSRAAVIGNLRGHAYAVEQAQPILAAFARSCALHVRRLTGRETGRTITRRRYESMWVLKKATDMSYPEIGAALKRHHSVAIRAVRATNERLASDDVLRARLEAFMRALERRKAA